MQHKVNVSALLSIQRQLDCSSALSSICTAYDIQLLRDMIFFVRQYFSASLFSHSLFPVRFHYIAWGTVSRFKLCVYWRVLDLAQQSGAALQHSTTCMPPPHSYVPLLFVVLKFNACWTTVLCMGRLKPMLQSSVELTSTSFSLGFLCFAPSKALGWILYKYLNASHSRCAQAEAPCWYKWIGLFWTDLVLEIFRPSLIFNDVCSNSFKQ